MPIFCSTCGLEIEPYEQLIPYRYKDAVFVYHGYPYSCYPFEKEDP